MLQNQSLHWIQLIHHNKAIARSFITQVFYILPKSTEPSKIMVESKKDINQKANKDSDLFF